MRKVWEALRAHPIVLVVIVLAVAYALFGDNLPSIDAEKILDDLADSLGQWTYLVVAVLAFLETGAFVGLVFPGETAVIIAGAIAGQGETSIVITIALVWVSAWAGDSVSFYIGTRLGRDFILRHGHRVRITPERFAQVEDYFSRHGGKTILVGRFLGLVRALAPFIAGSSGMRYRAFLPYSVLGTGLWAATFSLLGYFLANNIDLAEDIAGRGIFVFGALVVVVVGSIVAVRYLRVPENRVKLVERMEGNRFGEPLVAAGRRFRPQARFLWQRITPGQPGAGVHDRDGGAGGVALHRDRVRRDRHRRSGTDPGGREGVRDRRRPAQRLVHGRERGGDDAGLGAGDARRRAGRRRCARAGPPLAGAGGARGRGRAGPSRGADPQGGDRPAAARGRARRRREGTRGRAATRPTRSSIPGWR